MTLPQNRHQGTWRVPLLEVAAVEFGTLQLGRAQLTAAEAANAELRLWETKEHTRKMMGQSPINGGF